VQVMIYRDSHENDGFRAFNEIYRNQSGINLIRFGRINDCALIIRGGRPVSLARKGNCRQRLDQIGPLARRLNVVVLSARRYLDTNSTVMKPMWLVLHSLLESNPGLKFIVLSHYFRTVIPCAEIIRRFGDFGSCFQPRFADFDPFVLRARDAQYLAKEQTILNFLYINKTNILCNGTSWDTCETHWFGEQFSYDRHHLSLGYARLLGRRIAQVHGK
jgi:hypothetical protein